MKKITSLLVLLLLIISGCSNDVDALDVITNEGNLINQENLKTPSIRASVVGNQDFSLFARKSGNGNVSGHWRDSQQGGMRVSVECMLEFESIHGPGLLITGTVVRGQQVGTKYFTFIYDEVPYDAVTQRISMGNFICEDLLAYANNFYPTPINKGQVKINN